MYSIIYLDRKCQLKIFYVIDYTFSHLVKFWSGNTPFNFDNATTNIDEIAVLLPACTQQIINILKRSTTNTVHYPTNVYKLERVLVLISNPVEHHILLIVYLCLNRN